MSTKDPDHLTEPGGSGPQRKPAKSRKETGKVSRSRKPAAETPADPSLRMMAYLDGEMTKADREAFEKTLESHPEWRDELHRLAEVSGLVDQLRYKPVREKFWDGYWEEIEPRLWEKKYGLIAMGIGLVLLLSLVAFWIIFLFDHLVWQVSSAIILFGGLTVFISVLRGKIEERQKDRYRKVRR